MNSTITAILERLADLRVSVTLATSAASCLSEEPAIPLTPRQLAELLLKVDRLADELNEVSEQLTAAASDLAPVA